MEVFLNILYIFVCAGSLLLCGSSLVAASKGYSLAAVYGPLTGASLVGEHRL